MARVQWTDCVRGVFLSVVLLLPAQPMTAINAIPAAPLSMPSGIAHVVQPLPQGSGGPTPNGMACCINGMVWFNGAPVEAAEVTIQSAAGSVKVITQVFSGTTSTEARPFYQALLFQPPLSARPGEVVTLTARFSGYTQTILHTVQARGQQVDITIPRPKPGVLGFASTLKTDLSADELFRYPAALASDSRGRVFVAGFSGAHVWVYEGAGLPVRAWGSYGNLPNQFGRIAALAIDKQDHVYVVDSDNKRVSKFTNDGRLLFAWPIDCAQCAQLGRLSIAVKNNGNVLINTNVVGAGETMEFDLFGSLLRSRRHDNNQTGFSIPGHPGVAIDDAGFIYVADYRGGRVIKYTPDWQQVTNERWSSTEILGAMNVQFGPDGDIYVLRSFVIGVETRMFIQRYNKTGDLLQSLHLNSANALALGEVWDMTISNARLLLADRTANRILKVPLAFDSSSQTEIWMTGSTNSGIFANPRGVSAVGDDVYVTDCGPGTLTRFRNGMPQKTWNGIDAGFGANWCPFDLARDAKGRFWTVDASKHQLQRFAINGDSIVQAQAWGSLGTALGQFNAPSGLGVGASASNADLVFIADTTNGRVQAIQIDPAGTLVPLAATSLVTGTENGQFVLPWDVVADESNNVFVVDYENHRLTKLSFNGNTFSYVGQYGSLGGGDNQLNRPAAVARGVNGNVFVADGANSRVVEVNFSGSTGTQVNVYGSNLTASSAPGSLSTIIGLGFDAAGSLFTVQGNNLTPRIQKLSLLSYTAPVAAITSVSENASSLPPNSVLTVTGVGQPSADARTIVAYKWTLTSSLAGEVKVFTTLAPQLVLPASQLIGSVQTIQLEVQDSAGEWSLPAASDVRIHVSPFPQTEPTPPPTTPPGTATPPPACSHPSWLMMIYASADNPDDGDQLLARLREVLASLEGIPNNCVRIAAQIDGPASITRPISDTTRWEGTPGTPLKQVSMDEQAMDDASTLHSFIRWAQDNHRAEHYYLAITDHGQGILGTAWDFSTNQFKDVLGPNNGSHYLRTSDIAQALSSNDIIPLDILHLDSCSMGLLDVAYDLRSSAAILIASQYLGWATFGYDNYAQAINDKTTPQQLASEIVNRYHRATQTLNLPHTLAALDLKQAEDIKIKLDQLAVLLTGWVSVDPSRRADMATVRNQSQWFNSNTDLINSGADAYVDALDWARNISDTFSNPITQREINAAARDLVAALERPDGFVLSTQLRSGDIPAESCRSAPNCNVYIKRASGISLYYPSDALIPSNTLRAASVDTVPLLASQIYADYINQQSFDVSKASRWSAYLNASLAPRSENASDQVVPLPPLALKKQVYLPIIVR